MGIHPFEHLQNQAPIGIPLPLSLALLKHTPSVPVHSHESSMNHRLHMRINLHHPLIQIREIPHQHLRIESHSHKQRRDTTLDWHQEDISDLETDEESKGHDDHREGVVGVVGRLGEVHVKVGEQGAEVGDEDGAHGEDGVDEALVDEGVDAAVFHHVPG